MSLTSAAKSRLVLYGATLPLVAIPFIAIVWFPHFSAGVLDLLARNPVFVVPLAIALFVACAYEAVKGIPARLKARFTVSLIVVALAAAGYVALNFGTFAIVEATVVAAIVMYLAELAVKARYAQRRDT
jgi:hypothetical protein